MGSRKKLIIGLISMLPLLSGSIIAYADIIIEGGLILESNEVIAVENITIIPYGTLNSNASIRVSGNWSNSGTYKPNNSSVYFTGDGESVISGLNTFYNLISDHNEDDTGPGKALKFDNSNTQKVINRLTLKGSPDNLMAMTSTVDGSAATLEVSSSTEIDAKHLRIKDSTLSGYESYPYPGDDNDNIDVGGNSGWFDSSATVGGILVSTKELLLTEGDTGDFTVKLKYAPVSKVVLNATSSDETKAALSLSVLTFTADNWKTEQTVTVTTVNNYDLEDNSSVITLTVDEANSDSSFHDNPDQRVSVIAKNTDTALGIIKAFSNGDGATPPPPSLSIYQAAGISGVAADNLAVVNATVLAAEAGEVDTVTKVQALVDRLQNPDQIRFNPSDLKTNDPAVSQLLEEYAIELASIVVSKKNGKYESVLNHMPNSAVSIGTGRPGSELINTDSDSNPEIYILIKAGDAPKKSARFSKASIRERVFMWNPTANTFDAVTVSLDHAKHSSHQVNDFIGYPLGEKSLPDASIKMHIAGSTEKSDQSVTLWGYSKGQMVPVTRPVTSASVPNSDGRYPWQVTAEDYIKPLDIGANLVVAKSSISLSLPLALTVIAPEVNLSISANRKQASVGSVVTYTVELDNSSPYPLNNIAIRNDIPLGFSYVKNSAHWDHDGDAQTPMVAVATSSHDIGKVLQFDVGNVMEAPISHKLRYQLRIGSGVNKGSYTNSVIAVDHAGTPNILADDVSLSGSQASTDIRVIEDALFELSTVIGKVFNDVNGNGLQDPGDLPVPYARLVTSAGQRVTADSNGQYHLGNMRPGRMVVRIDERSLPDQTSVLGHRSQIVDIRPGIPSKVNFAVQLPSTVDNTPLIRIEQLSKRLEPSLSIGIFGSGQIDSQQQRFVTPLEIRAYSNYAALIKKWQVLISEGFSRRVVKTFSGIGSDLFAPIYWDGMTDEDEFIDPQRDYYVELLVSDSDDREAYTYPQRLTLVESTEQFELGGTSDREGDRARASSYRKWLRSLTKEDKTARSHIRAIGRSIRVSGEQFSAIRISQDNQLLAEIPSYDKFQPAAINLLRAGSLSEDLFQENYIELIVPKGKLNIQNLRIFGDNTVIAANATVDDQSEQNLEERAFNSEEPLETEKQLTNDDRPVALDGHKTDKHDSSSEINGAIEEPNELALGQLEVLNERTLDTQQLSASKGYFLVGIVDAEIAYRDITDNIDLAQSGDSRYGDKIWKDGKVQLYFKGTVAGDYLVTASIDSERDRDDLFSNLDPDASYALYGDSASVDNLVTEADGALYLLIEKDLSWAKWGRLQAALDNSELASFQRSLQGAQVHYESTQSTAYGEPVTEVDAFKATARQKTSRVEFRSTGSSVYYLKHQGVMRDSLKLKVEVRDSVSGNVRSSQTLEMGNDYQFNAQSGRIIFWQPPEREVESELLMTRQNYALDKVYLVAEYSYSIADDWSQGISGVELQQAVADNIVVGVTRIDEQKLNSDYSLEGVNSTINFGADHSLTLEYARSESLSEPQFYSDDGGLSWGVKTFSSTDSAVVSGDAFSLRGQATLSEGHTTISYYGRSITEAFHSGYSNHLVGQKSIGFDVDHRFNERLSVRLKHHQQAEQDKTDDKDSSSTLQLAYDLSDKLQLTGELQHLDEGGVPADNIAFQGRYQFSEDTAFSLTQQASIKASGGSQTGLAVQKRVSDNLMVEGTIRDNESGVFYGVNGDYSLSQKLSLGAGLEQDSAGLVSAQVGTGYMPNKDAIYRLSVDSSALENGKSSRGLSLGTEHRVSDSTSLSTGTSLTMSGDDSRNSEDAKLSYKLADGREVYGSASHYKHQDNETLDDGHEISLGGDITSSWKGFLTLGQGDLHRLEGRLDKRRNLAIGANYVRPTKHQQKQLQGRLRYEVRQDRGMDDIDVTLLDLNIRGRLNQDTALMGSLNWGRSEDLDSGSVQAQNNRLDLGAAYRPQLQDNLNIIGKYSWVEDRQPQDQIGDLGLEAQKAKVFSTDILYDLSSKWSLGAKLALRQGEEKVQDLPWADSRRWLVASRIGYGLFEDAKLNIEYRLLKDIRARDRKDGVVIELAKRFNQKIEVAVGINYAGFSDDLGLMDYTEQRGYLRITGVME